MSSSSSATYRAHAIKFFCSLSLSLHLASVFAENSCLTNISLSRLSFHSEIASSCCGTVFVWLHCRVHKKHIFQQREFFVYEREHSCVRAKEEKRGKRERERANRADRLHNLSPLFIFHEHIFFAPRASQSTERSLKEAKNCLNQRWIFLRWVKRGKNKISFRLLAILRESIFPFLRAFLVFAALLAVSLERTQHECSEKFAFFSSSSSTPPGCLKAQ